MKDFTLQMYERLLDELLDAGYAFVPFGEEREQSSLLVESESERGGEAERRMGGEVERRVMLRHDVDKKPMNSLATARIEAKKGIRASYYFRVVPESNDAEVIREVVRLGHEIGYHYEDISLCHGDVEKAKAHFDKWLAYFRTFYPVRTICMHGAPTSPWDGRKLWEKYDYKQEGILGEPYYDVDFSQTFYLTDTGRCWDGYKVSVRDKIPQYQDQWIAQGLVYHHTNDVIRAIQEGRFPQQVMITTHPQRWTDKPLAWVKEMIMQTLKNTIKRVYVAKNTK